MLEKYLTSFKVLWSLGTAVAGFGPLALALPELTPPWPAGAATIATIFCAVAAILGVVLARENTKRGRRKQAVRIDVPRLAGLCLLAGLVGGLVYVASYSRYVVVETQAAGKQERKLRIVAGSARLDGIAPAPDIEALRDNNYEPEKVWTPDSLVRTRLLLFGSFAVTFFLLTFGVALLAGAFPKAQRGRS